MSDKFFDFVIHGGDYNPDQWMRTPEVWDEDMRLMKLAHINSASVGIFSWAALEPEEGVYNFGWLDEMMDKIYENGISVILATPSGARPAWLAKKYPEVLRVEETGVRNEYGVRHNHCLTSPVYREKVRNMNRMLAERYKDHPALKMWHISNEYSGECHCELCQQAFRDWLREYYHNDIDELNEKWWGGFWAHNYSDWSEINSPKFRGENHVSAMKLCWKRFVTDSTISFFENEIAPLREITPDIPVTTNLMRMYDGFDYQRMAKQLDLVSWDNYPAWGAGKMYDEVLSTAFCHDVFRSMGGGRPFFMMESTPSVVNWHPVNKIPAPGMHELAAVQALAHGSDSVQYFQWRKGKGGHEKYHGAVVDHCGHENTRVFREISHLGSVLEKLGGLTGSRCEAEVAIICDWENMWATKYFCGYNNEHRDYVAECRRWYAPFLKRGITADVISEDDDFSKYKLIIAPFMYMVKDGVIDKIESYVRNGGNFVCTYLTACVDKDDSCFLGGFPGGVLKDVFGVWAEETDAIPEHIKTTATFGRKSYPVNYVCDIIHANGAEVLGVYESDFYIGQPSVTKNNYGSGKAYYVAFRNDGELADDFCEMLTKDIGIESPCEIAAEDNVFIRKRGDFTFVMNFSGDDRKVAFAGDYVNVLTGETVNGGTTLPQNGYLILKNKN